MALKNPALQVDRGRGPGRLLGFQLAFREADNECGTLVGNALGGDFATVIFNDFVADRGSHAVAFKFVLAAQTLERFEDFGQVFFVETDAIVLHGNCPHVALLAKAGLDVD